MRISIRYVQNNGFPRNIFKDSTGICWKKIDVNIELLAKRNLKTDQFAIKYAY